jgi:gamma-glutamyl-gamma-aminobutyrate hydrolase PuuD
MTPIVGVVAGEANASWGQWHRPAVVLPASYAHRLSEAGALPILLPPVGRAAAAAVARLDAIVLAGGGDLAPSTYGGSGHPSIYGVDPGRDQAELAVTAAADDRGLPILAICRGLQVLNVARGGTLHPHLPDVVGHEGHSGGRGTYGRHPVEVTAGSRLAAAMGPAGAGCCEVATHHHQAVDRVGHGLVVVARARDGTVEAVEDPGRFVVAVQWHPEVDENGSLFRALVAAAGGPG